MTTAACKASRAPSRNSCSAWGPTRLLQLSFTSSRPTRQKSTSLMTGFEVHFVPDDSKTIPIYGVSLRQVERCGQGIMLHLRAGWSPQWTLGYVLLLVATFYGFYFPVIRAVCPSPLPCHCIGNQVIYCAFMRLNSLPYFLDFKFVWQELDISENFISSLPPDGFRSVRVRHLRIGRNTIEAVTARAFASGPIDAVRVDLSHNRLESLPSGVFAPLTELRYVALQYNRLTVTGLRRAFNNVPKLLELDLQGNNLVTVPTDALTSLSSLRRLNLRHTGLQRVDAFAFRGLRHLEHLDLGDNRLPLVIHDDAFCGISMTSSTSVTPLDGPSYSSSPSFSKRKLSRTLISVEDDGVSPPSRSSYSAPTDDNAMTPAETPTSETDEVEKGIEAGLSVLKLDHNGLLTINSCMLKSIRSTLRDIDLTGNPLICDCRLLEIIASLSSSLPAPSSSTWRNEAMSVSRIAFPGAQCARPSHLAGLYLDSLDDVDSTLMTLQNAVSSSSTRCTSKDSLTARRHSNETSTTSRRISRVEDEHLSVEHTAVADSRCRRSCLSRPPPLLNDVAMSSVRSDSAPAHASMSSSVGCKVLVAVVLGLVCFLMNGLMINVNSPLPDERQYRSSVSIVSSNVMCER